jgi:hypothetical protein
LLHGATTTFYVASRITTPTLVPAPTVANREEAMLDFHTKRHLRIICLVARSREQAEVLLSLPCSLYSQDTTTLHRRI